MSLRRILPLAAFLCALLPGPAQAAGGDYVIDGGSAHQRAQVVKALEASSFDWGIVRRQVTVHIGAPAVSHSTPGHVWLEARLLDAGIFSWATVMDEYAHQVDFFVLDPARRALLQERLGARGWCYEAPGLAHGDNGCERFAAMVAWAYWPTAQNAYKPTSRSDESASMPAAEFRALLAGLIGTPRALASVRTVKSVAAKRR